MFFSKQLKFTGGFFWNRYRNLITTTFDPVFCAPFSTFGFCPQQLGEASTKGWEAGVTYTYSSDQTAVEEPSFVQAQYTNTLTRDLDSQSRLPRWPTDQWSASDQLPTDRSLVDHGHRAVRGIALQYDRRSATAFGIRCVVVGGHLRRHETATGLPPGRKPVQ
jgi:hypothetical protein